MNDQGNFFDDIDDELELEQLIAAKLAFDSQQKLAIKPSLQPMFKTLFEQSVEPGDTVLLDFARHVVGPLSDHFAVKTAKGGAFFQQKEQEGAKNANRYGRDQSLRAHLINGMLPALHIARCLKEWGALPMNSWNDTTERLFIAGYMLHDYTKIDEVQKQLEDEGFVEREAPSERQIPHLEKIFRDWCQKLGLDRFLEPVVQVKIQDLIYIACNTQVYSGTIHAPILLPDKSHDVDTYMLPTTVSCLADALAYIAPTPPELVLHKSIRERFIELAVTSSGKLAGRLVYHHIAENRGLVLNLIHDAVLDALTLEDQRVPLLYAPSGVVYLERHDAPLMPAPEILVPQIVDAIREKAGNRLVATRKACKLGKDGLRVDEAYNDFFNVREFILASPRLVELIKNNAPQYVEYIREAGLLGANNLPDHSTDPRDSRLRQLAEWASMIEIQFEDRLPSALDWFVTQLLGIWQLDDLAPEFEEVRKYVHKGTGIRYRWYWVAAHVLNRQSGIQPESVLKWIYDTATLLVAELPDELPPSAQANEETWADLTDYVGRVLTLGGAKTTSSARNNELIRYTRAKAGRGGAVCAICGGEYVTRKPAETAVSFQPGVYTQRIKIGGSDNKRNLCSICALEQLLRQLFVDNLDSGGSAEGQRIRYLSFYPSYFFTPETLRFMRRVYGLLKDLRLSDKDLRQALRENNLMDAKFWQRLDPFLVRAPSEEPSWKVLRYSSEAQATFLMVGFRAPNNPSDSEAWILPAFLALVLPICLDVKVVASESGVPLLLESGELPETVWFDGAHAAIRALIQKDRLRISDRDQGASLLETLARLTAAYMIHLDTEYAPPKENWHRIAPIAHSLTESPLYVFHYLKKQERAGDVVSHAQVRRYVQFAESLFNTQGDVLMSHARELVELYRQFYRAKTVANANSILRPLSVVSDALLAADMRLFSDTDSLVEVAYGELYRFMDRVSKGLADGRFPKGVTISEREVAMRRFCQKFVNDVFIGVFNRDVAALRGKQLNLLRSACEVLYRDMQQSEWDARGQDESDEIEETEL